MKYYIIAGEASGDLHGSNLIKALKKKDSNATIRCWGGDLMRNAGGHLAKHYKEMAFMGFWEVIVNIFSIFKNIRFCKADIDAFQPDALIFIDFSGFNLRIAKWAKAQGFSTNYYISPQIWASRENRINAIKRDIDAMYVILPFEKAFYEEKHNYPVEFVGHPLIDAITQSPEINQQEFRTVNRLHPTQPIIALLPGSRKQEIQKVLPILLAAVPQFKEYQFVIAQAPSLSSDFYTQFLETNSSIHLLKEQTYSLLKHAHAALVTSGTATLETALFNVPQVVCYKGNWVSYQIAKRIITLKFISLVNLIMDKEVVTELIQDDLNSKNLIYELGLILTGPKRDGILESYKALEKQLGGAGASENIATLLLEKM